MPELGDASTPGRPADGDYVAERTPARERLRGAVPRACRRRRGDGCPTPFLLRRVRRSHGCACGVLSGVPQRVFLQHHLARGIFTWRGRRVDPSLIRNTALLTVEG